MGPWKVLFFFFKITVPFAWIRKWLSLTYSKFKHIGFTGLVVQNHYCGPLCCFGRGLIHVYTSYLWSKIYSTKCKCYCETNVKEPWMNLQLPQSACQTLLCNTARHLRFHILFGTHLKISRTYMTTGFDELVKQKTFININSEACLPTIKAVHLCYLSAFVVST